MCFGWKLLIHSGSCIGFHYIICLRKFCGKSIRTTSPDQMFQDQWNGSAPDIPSAGQCLFVTFPYCCCILDCVFFTVLIYVHIAVTVWSFIKVPGNLLIFHDQILNTVLRICIKFQILILGIFKHKTVFFCIPDSSVFTFIIKGRCQYLPHVCSLRCNPYPVLSVGQKNAIGFCFDFCQIVTFFMENLCHCFCYGMIIHQIITDQKPCRQTDAHNPINKTFLLFVLNDLKKRSCYQKYPCCQKSSLGTTAPETDH